MNWSKLILAAIGAAVVTWLADFVMHGLILGPTYARYDVFTKQQASPFTFLLISLCIAVMVALFYAKSYGSWGGGWKGGATFGFFLGLAAFFTTFYSPVVLEGFPYFLSWCWGGINVIDGVIGGAVIGMIYKP
jgi:hypothetical protein